MARKVRKSGFAGLKFKARAGHGSGNKKVRKAESGRTFRIWKGENSDAFKGLASKPDFRF
jgi:hypothetical protein